jgi:hypothetical protein
MTDFDPITKARRIELYEEMKRAPRSKISSVRPNGIASVQEHGAEKGEKLER